MNTVFHTGMTVVLPQWASLVTTISGVLTFPVTNNIITIKNQLAQTNTLATIPYTIGYTWQDEAAQAGIPYANFKNAAGTIIVPSADSVLFAVMEKGGNSLIAGSATTILDLTIPSGATAWPFTSYSYLAMRSTSYRQTCAIKTAM
jgi:uncharacterized membrane protein